MGGSGGKRPGAGAKSRSVREALDTSTKMKQRQLFSNKTVNASQTENRERKRKQIMTVSDRREREQKAAHDKVARDAKGAYEKEEERKQRLILEKLQAETADFLQHFQEEEDNRTPYQTYDSDDDSDYEDIESSDEDEDNDTSVSATSAVDATSSLKTRNRANYFPPPESPVGQYIDAVIQRVKSSLHENNATHPKIIQKWYPPPSNSLESCTKSNVIDPSSYYVENTWIYVFLPFLHHADRIGKPLKDFKCICCQKKGGLKSNGWFFRPAHQDDHIVWIIHRRLVCSKPCGKTFATFHPKFMEQLPNCITERFPFMMTGSGQGMALSMVHQFMTLCTNGVAFGSFANAVNESKRTKYMVDQANYYDNVADIQRKKAKFGIRVVGKPFSPYGIAGEYNGIVLTTGLVKNMFLIVSPVVLLLASI